MIRVLHLSDIHFGRMLRDGKDVSAHYFIKRPSGETDPERLSDILVERSVLRTQAPHIVVVSGDIGWSGASGDYDSALVFFKSLRQRWSNTKFVIAPGNHDVDRRESDDTKRQNAFVSMLKEFHDSSFEQLYPLWGDGSSRSLLVGIHDIETTLGKVIVVASNSAARLQTESTPVIIERDCLDHVSRELERRDPNREALRLFVLHHHLFPFAEPAWEEHSASEEAIDQPDDTLVANSARLQGWLARHGFGIALHGHKHISHGRHDTLWRRQDQLGRRLAVIGAGSAGVEAKHLGRRESLSFNLLNLTRVSTRRWLVDVQVHEIQAEEMPQEAVPWYSYSTTAGAEDEQGPAPQIFHAQRMDDCHRAIGAAAKDKGLLLNFLSVVEDPTYHHPEQTIRFKGQTATQKRVEQTFEALHPEYTPTKKWTDIAAIDKVLSNIPQAAIRFEHGSRMFTSPTRRPHLGPDEVRKTSPLHAALDRVRTSPSTAYMSLYRPELDVLAVDEQPMPGLMSLQFVPTDSDRLDLVATFRKIELSYWWVVNMMEMGRILAWASKDIRKKPGRITFFAAMAEWKADPEAATTLELDRQSLQKLATTVLTINKPESREQLVQWLEEKATGTNENNLDTTGLDRLRDLLTGAEQAEQLGDSWTGFLRLIEKAAQSLDDALRGSAADRKLRIDEAAAHLMNAVQTLRTGSTSTTGTPSA
jgi:predicted MPP superfamily phosphohydrolase